MTGVLRHFLSAIFSIDLKVLSLRYDLKTCQTKCKEENGHLPYLYQALDRDIANGIYRGAALKHLFRVEVHWSEPFGFG